MFFRDGFASTHPPNMPPPKRWTWQAVRLGVGGWVDPMAWLRAARLDVRGLQRVHNG